MKANELSKAARNRRRSMRRHPKVHARMECRKLPSGLGPDLAESVLDLSETGAKLRLKSALDQGQEVEVLVYGHGSQKPIKLHARVVWTEPSDEQGCCAGLRFDKPLRYSEYQYLT